MRILIVTDAWLPQVNGVVRTLSQLDRELAGLGHRVVLVAPDRFATLPCPTYPEIRLALRPRAGVARAFAAFDPEAVHIATEGPLGWAARRHCLDNRLPFTTAFHTRFPDYLHARFGVPRAWSFALLRRFHGAGAGVMAATASLARELAGRGFGNVRPWTRGVDTALFRPLADDEVPPLALPRPVFLFVGRLAVEKNLEAFLGADLPGTKLVVGDGPQRAALAARFPEAVFAGAQHGEALARHYRMADVFVFPSRTDTFGLVMLEALASGVPVAAYPVPGPLDVIGDSGAGALGDDLAAAAMAALSIPRAACRAHAARFNWRACARLFVANLAPFGGTSARAA
ncbi:MAG: glycosyltransferase family 1 protein [Alphaproteobacteria bacterium]